MAIIINVLLRYAVLSMITHQATLRDARPNTAPFFSKVGLTKLVLASELFIPGPYFISHSTAKKCAKISSDHGSLFNLFSEEGSQN